MGRGQVPGRSVNRRMLAVSELERIPELMAIYERYAEWEWRFGESPSFSHSLEHKFDWALVDVHVDVEGAHRGRAHRVRRAGRRGAVCARACAAGRRREPAR